MKKSWIRAAVLLSFLRVVGAASFPVSHLAVDHGWQTSLIADNAGWQAAVFTVSVYNQGQLIGTTQYSAQPGETRQIVFSSGTCAVVNSENPNLGLKAAYIHTTGGGVAEFRLAASTATVLDFALPHYLADELTWTGIAVMNTGDQTASLVLTGLDAAGTAVASASRELAAGCRLAQFVPDCFPGQEVVNVVRIRVSGNRPLAGITISGLDLSRLLFMPAIPPGGGSSTLLLPHLGGYYEVWDYRLILDNRGSTPVQPVLQLYHSSQRVVEEPLTVPPGGSRVIGLNQYAALDPDSGILNGCPSELVARLSYVNLATGAGAEYQLTGPVAADLVLHFPRYAGDQLGWNGFALANPAARAAMVVLKAFRGNQEVARELVQILPYSRYVNMLENLFPEAAAGGIDRLAVCSPVSLGGVTLSGEGQQRYLFAPAIPFQETRTVEERLRALPGVQVASRPAAGGFTGVYQLDISMPLDHEHPEGAVFIQTIYLGHRDPAQPMILLTSGYAGPARLIRAHELAFYLTGNQITMGHRFFSGAIPQNLDWSKLTIRQAAADSHHLVALLREIYRGPWINSGHSKGGMTAIFHRRFWPLDVEATVAYVAPMILDYYDDRFEDFVDNRAGTAQCRNTLRQFQRRLLSRRSELIPMLEQRAQENNDSYDLVGAAAAFEYQVMEYPVAFWQYGPPECSSVPGPFASSREMFEHLFNTVQLLYSDWDVLRYRPFYYQAVTEFGYYSFNIDSFDEQLITVPEPTWNTFAPPGVPLVYDPAVMPDIDQWVKTLGDRMIFIYGGNDPWTSVAVELTGQTDAIRIIQPGSNHGQTIRTLTEQELVFGKLENWLNVTVNREVFGLTGRLVTATSEEPGERRGRKMPGFLE